MVVDDSISAADYVENPNHRDLVFTSSDMEVASVDEAGNIIAAGPGDAVVTVFAAATNTEVIAIQKVTVDVRGEGYPSKYHVKSMSELSTADEALIYTADKDVVEVTVELVPGEHKFNITKGEELFGKNITINDYTDSKVTLNGTDAFTLNATGGYYTFTYRISTSELSIAYEPLDLTETGSKTATIYVNYKNSSFTDIPYIYVWEPGRDAVNKNIGPLYPGVKLEGPNAEGYFYRTFKYDESYQFVLSDGQNLRTADSIEHTESEVYVTFEGDTTYTEGKPKRFWVDLTPDDASDPIDRLYPELDENGDYYLYLPAGIDGRKLKFYVDDGLGIKITYFQVKPTGTSINLNAGINKNNKYRITDLSNVFLNYLVVKQSSSLSSVYVYTDEIMPMETGYNDLKDSYETNGSIKVLGSNAKVTHTESEITAISGVNDDSWNISNDVIGKYGYELTLSEAQTLIEGAEAGTDYVLLPLSEDEARMRDMTMLELARMIGIDSTASCQPIDLYNNGRYMGSYLITEKPAKTASEDAIVLEFTDDSAKADFVADSGQKVICTGADAEQIANLWNAAEEVIYNENASYEELSAVIDVGSFAKMYLIEELAKTPDAGEVSYYVYYENGKFYAASAWDYAKALGQSAGAELTDPEGWYASEKTLTNSSVLTAQAALCQNEVFMNAVKTEWNEVFYEAASEFTTGEVTSATALGGKFAQYYTELNKSIVMDEVKWETIGSDPLESEGLEDTGDTFADAAVVLNNFYYQRLQWMNEELSKGYTLAPPTLETSKPMYAVNEEIVLTASIGSSGTLTYEFYNSKGELVHEVTTDAGVATYTFATADEIDETYSVVITSGKANVEPVTASTQVVTFIYELELEVEAPEKVSPDSWFTLTLTPNTDEEVTYKLKDTEGNLLDISKTGIFDIYATADEAQTVLEYVIEATTTISGIEYSATETVAIEIFRYEMSVELTANEEVVEAGMEIVLVATTHSDYSVKYTFYNAKTDSVIGVSDNGVYTVYTTEADGDTVMEFYVVAESEVYGNVYSATSETIRVEVTSVRSVYDVTVYFKSTSTLGYRPMITTEGAVKDLVDYEMAKDIFISKNETETASYYWYKAEFTVSTKAPTAFIRILSSRYAMEVQTNLILTESKTYYFAVDDLNGGTEIVDLTEASPDERNWCESATHMVYDPRYDSEDSLAETAARIDLRFVGDTNADGKVNIRDATYIQKGLADILTMSATDREVADVDDDFKVTIKDVTAIQKKLAGFTR